MDCVSFFQKINVAAGNIPAVFLRDPCERETFEKAVPQLPQKQRIFEKIVRYLVDTSPAEG
jgi:hypothetical protein